RHRGIGGRGGGVGRVFPLAAGRGCAVAGPGPRPGREGANAGGGDAAGLCRAGGEQGATVDAAGSVRGARQDAANPQQPCRIPGHWAAAAGGDAGTGAGRLGGRERATGAGVSGFEPGHIHLGVALPGPDRRQRTAGVVGLAGGGGTAFAGGVRQRRQPLAGAGSGDGARGCGARGAGGVVLAEGLMGGLGPEAAPLMPRAGHLALDGRVLAFTLGLALLTTALCGLAPAWWAARRQPAEVLQLHDRGHARLAIGTRGMLVAGEIALALLLLVGAGLLLRSWMRVQALDRGFNPQGALSFVIGLPEPQYPHRADELRFFRQAQAQLAAVPEVAVAGGIYPLPFASSDWEENFSIVGRPAPAVGAAPSTNMANV